MIRTTTTTILLGLATAFAAMPAADAYHPSAFCDPVETRHSYTGFGGAYGDVFTSLADAEAGVAPKPFTIDTCDTLQGDGENELGIGGGQFPAGNRACAINSHHAYGVGAEYWAQDEMGIAAVAYTVGADGPSLFGDRIDRCATDGVITNNPTTDPFDCGWGANGLHSFPDTWTPATLGENIPGTGACNPYDGYVWMFINAGPVVVEHWVVVSTPLSGHAWS